MNDELPVPLETHPPFTTEFARSLLGKRGRDLRTGFTGQLESYYEFTTVHEDGSVETRVSCSLVVSDAESLADRLMVDWPRLEILEGKEPK